MVLLLSWQWERRLAGIKSRFRELDGELAVFFGNKSAKLHFHNFATEYTVKEDTLLRLSMSTVPAMVLFRQF